MKTKGWIQKLSGFHTAILCWLRFKSPIPIGSSVVVKATKGELVELGITEDVSGEIFYVTNAIRMRKGRWVFLITDPTGYFYPEEFLKIVHNKNQPITFT